MMQHVCIGRFEQADECSSSSSKDGTPLLLFCCFVTVLEGIEAVVEGIRCWTETRGLIQESLNWRVLRYQVGNGATGSENGMLAGEARGERAVYI